MLVKPGDFSFSPYSGLGSYFLLSSVHIDLLSLIFLINQYYLVLAALSGRLKFSVVFCLVNNSSEVSIYLILHYIT